MVSKFLPRLIVAMLLSLYRFSRARGCGTVNELDVVYTHRTKFLGEHYIYKFGMKCNAKLEISIIVLHICIYVLGGFEYYHLEIARLYLFDNCLLRWT